MSFAEINLFGIYVAPIAPMMVLTWLATIGLRSVAARYGLLRQVWHPALFVFAVYVLLLAVFVLLLSAWGVL